MSKYIIFLLLSFENKWRHVWMFENLWASRCQTLWRRNCYFNSANFIFSLKPCRKCKLKSSLKRITIMLLHVLWIWLQLEFIPKMHFFIQNKCFNLRNELCCLLFFFTRTELCYWRQYIIKWYETEIFRYSCWWKYTLIKI